MTADFLVEAGVFAEMADSRIGEYKCSRNAKLLDRHRRPHAPSDDAEHTWRGADATFTPPDLPGGLTAFALEIIRQFLMIGASSAEAIEPPGQARWRLIYGGA
jgi:hypothetical protein